MTWLAKPADIERLRIVIMGSIDSNPGGAALLADGRPYKAPSFNRIVDHPMGPLGEPVALGASLPPIAQTPEWAAWTTPNILAIAHPVSVERSLGCATLRARWTVYTRIVRKGAAVMAMGETGSRAFLGDGGDDRAAPTSALSGRVLVHREPPTLVANPRGVSALPGTSILAVGHL
jgi:hypothetical protein